MLEPLPPVQPPRYAGSPYARGLPARAAFDWLRAGWDDFRVAPGKSLAYGALISLLCYVTLFVFHAAGMLYLALPATAGFLIIAPMFALGLYERSRRRVEGKRTTIRQMLTLWPAAGGQVLFAGLMLALLVMMWLRTADLLYALFFGLVPFPGATDALTNVLTTSRGWMMLACGVALGGLFAAFAFAISLFSFPIMLTENRDALTAMGLSFAMTNRNLGPCLLWGLIVMIGMILSMATALIGLAVIFPVLGYGTWHAFRAIDTGQRT